jgi:uncharacterized protein YndB with AHSA1/START domain
METKEKTEVTVHAKVNAPVDNVWKLWTTPEDIVKWNYAIDTWHTPRAENDLRVGGRFSCRMEAKDGSMGFDFWGIYDNIVEHKLIESTLGDGRKIRTVFCAVEGKTDITETFEAENENPVEMQRNGWQAILDHFKAYAETNKNI